MKKVSLYDTTLRDGAQREGISFSVEDKLRITQKLDDFGIHYIEGGWPGSNPKDIEYFKKARQLKLKNAKPVSFGSTRRANTSADKDDNIRALVEAGVKTVCVVGKSWGIHAVHALKTTLDENLKMISDSVSYLKKQGLEVFFDAEHFFDGYRDDPAYAMKTLKSAAEAGADCLVLCDTNGGALPLDIKQAFFDVRSKIQTPLGIHAHNDGDCAVANSITAVQEGAVQVQGTINGYGERCGNANLCSIIPALVLKLDILCISQDQLRLLQEVSHFVSEVANLPPNTHQPYVGESAFAHKGGLHVSALVRKHAYEHIDPALVGNIRRVVVSELAGKSTIVVKAQELGIDLSKEPQKVADILRKVKELEHIGYYFEAADGSFELLIRKATGTYTPFFRLESFRVIMDRTEEGQVNTEATIKLHVKGRRIVETAEGNGPVNALDRALRQAIERAYPALKKIELTDYKVRVLDEKRGTAAVVRVLIDTSDGEKVWSTIGVSENIIEASWQALVDSIDYGLLHKKD
jgi:2-isopropylmalate synthase